MNHLLDLGSRKVWRLVGKPVDLTTDHSWLRAPVSHASTVGDGWLAAEAAHHGGTVDDSATTDPSAGPAPGLLPAMTILDGPGFDASRLDPRIRDFYEHTAAWHMEVWTGWSPLFWPAGELIESGNVQVFLRPVISDGGGLVLESPPGRFGQDGAYVVVHDGGRDFAARVPLHETFRLYCDPYGVLRTDHELRMWRTWMMRLHYKMERAR